MKYISKVAGTRFKASKMGVFYGTLFLIQPGASLATRSLVSSFYQLNIIMDTIFVTTKNEN